MHDDRCLNEEVEVQELTLGEDDAASRAVPPRETPGSCLIHAINGEEASESCRLCVNTCQKDSEREGDGNEAMLNAIRLYWTCPPRQDSKTATDRYFGDPFS